MDTLVKVAVALLGVAALAAILWVIRLIADSADLEDKEDEEGWREPTKEEKDEFGID